MKLKTVLILTFLVFCTFFVIKASDLLTPETESGKIEAELTFENFYEECFHTERYTSPVKETFANIEELCSTYPPWKIKSNKKGKIILTKSTPGYCNNHYNIVLTGNKVTVSRLRNNAIYKEFYISLKYLTDSDITELENGKTVNSNRELTEFIEDFTS